MALTDTFVRQVKPGKAAGGKYADGGGMYLLVKEAGKYWRMNYRFLGKCKTLALGVYPAVSLACRSSTGQWSARRRMCRASAAKARKWADRA